MYPQHAEADKAKEQAASLILDNADSVKDMDENFQIQTANSPPDDTPKTECIRTPLHQVDGHTCILSRVRAGVRASPPLGFPSLSRTHARNGFQP
jgi:hypothetical protein